MASFTTVDQTDEINVPEKGHTITITLVGDASADQDIRFEVERGSPGSGSYELIRQDTIGNSVTLNYTYNTARRDERVRLFLFRDGGGTITTTLTDAAGVQVQVFEDSAGNEIMRLDDDGVTIAGTLTTDGAGTTTGASTLTGNVSAAGTLAVTGTTSLAAVTCTTIVPTSTADFSAAGITGTLLCDNTVGITGALSVTSIVSTDANLDIDGVAAAQGGLIDIQGGTSSTAGNVGGVVNVTGGTPGATSAGAAVAVTGGIGGGTSGTGGAVTVTGGVGTNGDANGGAVTIEGGLQNGTGAPGVLNIATTNTDVVNFGHALTTTAAPGGFTVAPFVMADGTNTITLDPLIHANKPILILDASIAITLPAATGTGNFYYMIMGIDMTAFTCVTEDTSNAGYVGIIHSEDTDAGTALFWAAAHAGTDDTITMDGTATGGKIYNWIKVLDIAADRWVVEGAIGQSGGSEVTPFSSAA